MKWASRMFGAATERKSGWRPTSFAALAAGDAGPPASYEGRLVAAMRNATAYRAIRLVSEGLASVPLHVAGEDHPVLGLVTPQLLEPLAVHLLLHGNAFVQTGLGLGDLPVALWTLRPERMQVETDPDGMISGWIYRVNGRAVRLSAEGSPGDPGILHMKAFDPLDDHLGTGALPAATAAIAMLEQAGRWNRSLLANAARPSGALVLDSDEGPLSSEQFARLREEVEAGFQGAINAGRPMLLEGGLKWQPLAMTPAEMDFQKAREAAAREVALAFGVPPMLLGQPGDSTHANYAEANVALWRLTILPMLERILAGLSQYLAQWWPGLRLEADLDRIPALWSDRERLWRHVGEAQFLSDDEKREMLGWGAAGHVGQVRRDNGANS